METRAIELLRLFQRLATSEENSVIDEETGERDRDDGKAGDDSVTAIGADELARATAAAMFAADRASQMLGMKLGDVEYGRAVVTMTVRADMLNGFGIAHGALIAALADSAFAFACNSSGELTVASGITVDFIAPAHEGDVLAASAAEVARTGRTGVYDVTVVNQDGALVLTLRGRSFTIKGKPSVPPAG